jgi:hypothetical protein
MNPYSGWTTVHLLLAEKQLMRVTLTIDDEAHKALKQYAKAHSMTMGKAASILIRRGLYSLLLEEAAETSSRTRPIAFSE